MQLSIGFSPCPNDTFIFDALVNGKIDTKGIDFEVVMEDIETLNQWSNEGRLDITKLSFPAFFKNIDQYISLLSGAALGNGVGPLLVANAEFSVDQVAASSIAIPGAFTTANFLLSFAFPTVSNKTKVLFSEIENTVLSGKTDLGVLIHENRFTYEQKGLKKIVDLGAYWEEKTNLPIPLACIAAKRSIDAELQKKVSTLIGESVEYSFKQYPRITQFVREHAQAMDEKVMLQHIDLYVNEFSISLGEAGKSAIYTLYDTYLKTMDLTKSDLPLFIEA